MSEEEKVVETFERALGYLLRFIVVLLFVIGANGFSALMAKGF